jgi:hypothetical protein
MTLTPQILGRDYDDSARLSNDLRYYEPKRSLALAALRRAEAANDVEVQRLMYWELGLIDLDVVTADDPSPYCGGPYVKYAEFYRLADETIAYARERVNETRDVILRIHYLTFVLLSSEPSGMAWIELQRVLAVSLREFVEGCCDGAGMNPDDIVGVSVAHAAVASANRCWPKRGHVAATSRSCRRSSCWSKHNRARRWAEAAGGYSGIDCCRRRWTRSNKSTMDRRLVIGVSCNVGDEPPWPRCLRRRGLDSGASLHPCMRRQNRKDRCLRQFLGLAALRCLSSQARSREAATTRDLLSCVSRPVVADSNYRCF